ncbi:MAG: thermonuclease family protein, partial [Candidatus Omnitrophota bacterium]
VHEVLTGDTVRLKGGKTLKYVGVESPPLQNILPLVRQYGSEATEFNKILVAGKKILVEWGYQVRDEHNNLLGYVFLEDGTFVNREILRAGHGKAFVTAPNLKYSGDLRRAELEARRGKKGLWREEPENPFIKNEYIGDKNTKTFYFPNSPELERIPQSYLVTFRSRVEATAAGYRACHDCKEDNRALY